MAAGVGNETLPMALEGLISPRPVARVASPGARVVLPPRTLPMVAVHRQTETALLVETKMKAHTHQAAVAEAVAAGAVEGAAAVAVARTTSPPLS